MWYSSIYDMDRVRSFLNELFEDPALFENRRDERHSVNVYEDESDYYFQVVAPGVKNEDIDVDFNNGMINVKVKRKKEIEEGMKALREERSNYEFARSFHTPNKGDVEKAEAKLSNGLLTIVIPKKEDAKPKKIEVKVQ